MPHWPDDPSPIFERISDVEHGQPANVTFCRMTAHTGTHVDAPLHFLQQGIGIDKFPLAVGIGPARVIEIAPHVSTIGRRELEGLEIERGERILLKTRNSAKRWDDRDFETGFAAIDSTGAKFLAEAGIALIGVDYLSVGIFGGDDVETHKILLDAGIWIVEGLNLRDVREGSYDLICLPLAIENGDGSPARVVLREL